jgi:hypothetical protein
MSVLDESQMKSLPNKSPIAARTALIAPFAFDCSPTAERVLLA